MSSNHTRSNRIGQEDHYSQKRLSSEMSVQKVILTTFIHTENKIETLQSKTNHNKLSVPQSYIPQKLCLLGNQNKVQRCPCRAVDTVIAPRTKKLFFHSPSSWTVKKHEHEQVKHAAFSAAARGLFQKSLEEFKAGCIRVLAGRELMFFIVACMGLCLVFVSKRVLTMQGHFGYQ